FGGNVGIKNTNPTRDLEIGDGTGEAWIKLSSGPTSLAGLEFSGANMWKLERYADDTLRVTKMGVGHPIVIEPTDGNVGIGMVPASGYKLDVAGQIHSSSGGIVFPDGTTQTTAAATGGLLMRAIHTFKDCVVGGGLVHTIDEGKSICRFSGLPAGWTPYPTNWTTTTSVHCVDTKGAPQGWEPKYGTTECDTGGHSFADLPVESCTSVSTGQQCWYEGWFGANKVCGYVKTSTTCYATITERGGY
ncbi:MAG: hypothetical protein NUV61_02145, partial [Candidatus Azambacteria bacterium]|nr:hypothetical protein [Candidatus Azambacteria bacterium]